MKKKRPSVARIAEKCGVSPMTVSRALRNDPRVRETTRRNVLRTAEKLGYRPRANMGRPRRKHSKPRLLADVVFGVHIAPESVFYAELLISIERELRKHGHDCVVRTAGGDYDEFLSLCESLRASEAAGTFIVGYFPLEQLRTVFEIRPGAILVDHTGDPGLRCPYECVGFDNVEAARMGVRHLVDRGCRRIVLINGPSAHYFSRDIELGFRDILAERGLSIEEQTILEADFTAGGAHKLLCEAIDSGLSFDGIFTSDEMALGAMRALHQKGIRVPEDVAVMGCDGLPMGRYTVPSLSTVVLDYNKLGRLAVERIFADRSDGPRRVRLVPALEIRESTTPANS